MRKVNFRYFLLLICTVLLISSISLSFGTSAQAAENVTAQPVLEEELLSQNSDFVNFLDGVEQLPSFIIEQGPEKTANWLSEKTGVEVTTDGQNLYLPSLANVNLEDNQSLVESRITTFSTWGCVTAIGLMIGSVGFPFSKILKLKSSIKLLGGVKKTVQSIHKNYKKLRENRWRKKDAWKEAVRQTSSDLPTEVRDAFLDFFNISNVINQCT
ncbi:hypothetical protein CAI16_17235 [Virgibacillus dokdonensis]|uniref:Uncharacterized protein n=1 Tax=Virgibacillus dokdonensis TaxID=302167 RepID=A0A3E0WIC9_9BACI|nr:hypothetical protein [Virgibacillus dokdonensis]RFA32740.1 hypothetical protein CAI16_17235 [Virgibacillus dokdonensis]